MLRLLSSLLCLTLSTSLLAEDCQSERVKLQMLGTGGPELISYTNPNQPQGPKIHRASSGYLLWLDDKARIMIDAGPGTAHNFKQTTAQFDDLSLFLFTHFHVDHSGDFPAFVKGGFFTERQNDLRVFGPTGDTFILSAEHFVNRQLNAQSGVYPYLSPYIQDDSHSSYHIKVKTIEWTYKDVNIRPVYQDDSFNIKTVSVHHGPFPALAYRIEVAGCVLSFSGDMSGRLHSMPDLAQGSHLLVAHNAIPEDATGTPQLLHMKPSYIGKIAGRAGVKQLLLTHQMKRSMDRSDEAIKEIRKHYQGPILFPQDLETFHP